MGIRANTYPGVCRDCGARVEEGAGRIVKDENTGRWITYHLPGECPEARVPTKPGIDDGAADKAVDRAIGLIARQFMTLVPALVEENLALASRVAAVKVGTMPEIKVDVGHHKLEAVVQAVVAGVSPMLVGPAGSGKTTLAEQVAKVMHLNFYMASRVTSDFKLLGFVTANGAIVRTPFREAYEKGGIFLFDEVDASDPDALTAFNAALANGRCDFPDAVVVAHKDFHAIAAGNTYGRGADRQYVGRNQLDAATLDRFTMIDIDYDESLELALAGNADWTRHVQSVRKAIVSTGVRHIVSPRASINGAKLLAAGWAQAEVEEAVVWKGLDDQNRSRVQAKLVMEKVR